MDKKAFLVLLGLVIAAVAGSIFWRTWFGTPVWAPSGVNTLPPAPSPGTSTPPVSGTGSGIEGVVLLGPTCPVERIPPDPQCADRPYQTLVAVFPASDPVHAAAITTSDASGTFRAALPAGDYVVGAGESNLPRCAHVAVTVQQDGYATTTVYCDTGIR